MLQTQSDMLVVCHVAHILEQVVPKIEHPSESFMRELEEDLVKLIMKHGQMVSTLYFQCRVYLRVVALAYFHKHVHVLKTIVEVIHAI